MGKLRAKRGRKMYNKRLRSQEMRSRPADTPWSDIVCVCSYFGRVVQDHEVVIRQMHTGESPAGGLPPAAQHFPPNQPLQNFLHVVPFDFGIRHTERGLQDLILDIDSICRRDDKLEGILLRDDACNDDQNKVDPQESVAVVEELALQWDLTVKLGVRIRPEPKWSTIC